MVIVYRDYGIVETSSVYYIYKSNALIGVRDTIDEAINFILSL